MLWYGVVCAVMARIHDTGPGLVLYCIELYHVHHCSAFCLSVGLHLLFDFSSAARVPCKLL